MEKDIKAIAMALLDLTKADKVVAMWVTKKSRVVTVRVVVDNKTSYKWVFSP